MSRIAPLALPVFVTDHAVDQACLRSPQLANGSRHVVIADITVEVEDAIREGPISERKPRGRSSGRHDDQLVRFATSQDGARCHVVKLVQDNNVGPAWLVLTSITFEESEAGIRTGRRVA